jgi:cell division protease FtsH
MVCEWGMSDKMGPMSYGAKEEEIFLGREIQKHRDYSEKTAIEIDEEIRGIVNKSMNRAEKILMEHIDLLHKLSEELLEREILDSDEIERIIKGEKLPPVPSDGNGGKKKEEEIPDHVKVLIQQRKQKDTPVKDDAN